MKPTFTDRELACFSKHVGRCENYVEYGSGYSTYRAAATNSIRSIVSVESDQGWIEKLRDEAEVAEAASIGRLSLLHADIGPTKQLGYPVDNTAKDRWYTYALRPWEGLGAALRSTLVLIDGRFRVACALVSARKASSDTTIIIHDFWNRPQYHAALPYLEWLESADTMGVFRSRAGINSDRLLEDFERYQFVPD